MAARIRNAAQRLARRLDGNGHVKCVGVHDGSSIAHDRYMTLPEDQVAPSQAGEVVDRQQGAKRAFLHVAVTRTGDTGCDERDLHKPRTIDPKARLAAPQVRNANKTFCDGDEIRLAAFDGREMPGGDAKSGREVGQLSGIIRPPAFPPPQAAEAVVEAWRLDGNAAAEGQGIERRRLDGTAGKYECAKRRDPVGRRRSGRTKRVRWYPAHISVRCELSPTPAFAVFVVDRHSLTMQGFGIERRIGRRLPPHRRLRVADLKLGACNKAYGLDFALEVQRCEIRS